MRIGELARRSGLTASRIRFYEAQGLIAPANRSANGYRAFAADAIGTLEIISSAQRAGLSLEQIGHWLAVKTGGKQHDGMMRALQRQVAEIEAMQTCLENNKAQLLAAIDTMRASVAPITDPLACGGDRGNDAAAPAMRIHHGTNAGRVRDGRALPHPYGFHEMAGEG